MELSCQIQSALGEVFGTMIPLDYSVLERSSFTTPEGGYNVSGMIGISGRYQGMLTLHCPKPVAQSIAMALLMLEPDEPVADEDTRDAIGELVNMLAGGFKTRLADAGMDVNISVPTTIAGRAYSIDCFQGANCVSIPFRLEAGCFLIEFKYKETA